ncbi:MAG: hypothetical protein ACFFD4_04200 [Candidatus Odinarchaeota archaeon]
MASDITTDPGIVLEPKYRRTRSDNIRQFKFNLGAVKAEWKFIFRAIYRELKYLWVFQDLVVLALLLISVVAFVLFLLWFVPFVWFLVEQFPGDQMEIINGVFTYFDLSPPFKELFYPLRGPEMPINDANGTIYLQTSKYLAYHIHKLLWSNTTIRLLAGLGGIIAFFVRVMLKSEIRKFKDKADARKDACFIFGETKYAENLIYQLVKLYGYEDKVCLIHSKPFLWIDRIKGLINAYQIKNDEEYEKTNLYEFIEFKTAKHIMILTDDVEKNQNILTNIRAVKPDVPIIILKQYAPKFLLEDESGLIKDPKLIIIDDLEAIINGLIFSLSLDIRWPEIAEIDVPGNFIGVTGIQMTSDLLGDVGKPVGLEVLRIRREDKLLAPDTIMQEKDRVIVKIKRPFDMKKVNRVVTESPHVSKEEKKRLAEEEKKKKEEEKRKKEEKKKRKKEEKKKKAVDKKEVSEELKELEKKQTEELLLQEKEERLQRLKEVTEQLTSGKTRV